jgi:hypothetical protein
MGRKAKRGKANRAKTRLGLPDLEYAKSAVLVSLRSPESQRSYRRSIDDFVCWYCSEPRLSFNKTVVTRYRIHLEGRLLAPGTVLVQPEMERGRSPLVSIPHFGRGFSRHRYDHQAIPQHGCVPAEPASVSPARSL